MNDTSTQVIPSNLFHGVRDRLHARKLEREMQTVEKLLHDQLAFASPIADAAARYLAEAGGKRIRPLLTLLASQLGSGPNDLVRTAAVAIELTHLASLYHDDVMDEASMRRGVPAAHTVWSNSVAILAGDLLFARASSLVSGMGEEAILLQARTFERLCLGQLHETVGPNEGDDPKAHYMQVLADKTGALIATAARMGIMQSGAPAEYADMVMEYGERIGVAFQLIDDVLDLSQKQAQTGKIAGTDLRAGVVTLPVLLLRERAVADAAARDLLARIEDGAAKIQAGEPDSLLDAEVAELRDHDVTRETFDEAKRWAEDAVRAIAPLPSSVVKDALERLAESIITREG